MSEIYCQIDLHWIFYLSPGHWVKIFACPAWNFTCPGLQNKWFFYPCRGIGYSRKIANLHWIFHLPAGHWVKIYACPDWNLTSLLLPDKWFFVLCCNTEHQAAYHNYLFSHTQRVSVTLAITLCPSSSLLSLLSLSAWTFLVFQLLLSNRCTDLLQIFQWMFLGWTPTKFVKIVVLPLFFMELWVILCKFWPILKKSSSI